ncbi:hypothetical protein [Ulvibacterium marinum]|uniref:hypothetical protein n=1 Tax=Ulvibacterium marinum TaxID=2419782 RepID=UPI002493F64E|nr:hypothetical protein [Ulvibacterium marinum]
MADYVLECGKCRADVFCLCIVERALRQDLRRAFKCPDRKLREHNAGKSGFTKRYVPWQRFYLERAENVTEARKKEKYYKSGWGRKRLKSILEEWQTT